MLRGEGPWHKGAMNEDSFRRRLKRLHDAHHRQRGGDGGPGGVYSAADAVVEPVKARRAPVVAVREIKGWAALGAERIEQFGGYWLATKTYEASERHGASTVGAFRGVDHGEIGALEGFRGLGPEDLLYMDTETTGLGDGALAFMVGVGFWEGSRFVVEQFLMEDEGDEEAVLRAFAARLSEKRLLVTFNGRRFDAPLLARRFRRWGLEDPMQRKEHLDLLPLSRRQFAGRRRYRLASLEEDLLGFRRVGDVPGREIPGRWQRFERDQRAEPMQGVLEHNRLDIVSMAALLAKILAGNQKVERESGRIGRAKGVVESLERSYRLRGEFAKESGGRRRAREIEPVPVSARSLEEAVEERALELRGACAALIARGMWQEAFGMICEFVALKPEDKWGQTALAKYYRKIGKEELAQALEKRM